MGISATGPGALPRAQRSIGPWEVALLAFALGIGALYLVIGTRVPEILDNDGAYYYGVARHIYIPVIKRAVADFAVGADWTPAGGDVKISKDGGAAANVTNLPTAIVMGNGAMWDFSLTATST